MERSQQEYRFHEMKILEQRHLEESKELLGCTFKPNIRHRNTSLSNHNTTMRSETFR